LFRPNSFALNNHPMSMGVHASSDTLGLPEHLERASSMILPSRSPTLSAAIVSFDTTHLAVAVGITRLATPTRRSPTPPPGHPASAATKAPRRTGRRCLIEHEAWRVDALPRSARVSSLTRAPRRSSLGRMAREPSKIIPRRTINLRDRTFLLFPAP
jgi:hypothetical protein